MHLMLFDGEGAVLTEVRSHAGRAGGHLLVDWATRPDSLFQYYFDRGGRAVTLVSNDVRCAALLGTRWQMGARFWFLHALHPIGGAPRGRSARPTDDARGVATATAPALYAGPARTSRRAAARARPSENRGVPV